MQRVQSYIRDGLPLLGSSVLSLAVLLAIQPVALQPAAAQEAVTQPTADGQKALAEAELRQLIRQLDANSLAERDAAEEQLVAVGARILPLLPKVTARTSGEMKIRLQRIRQSLQSVSEQTFFKASTITLDGEMTVAEAISKIAEQSGNQIEFEGEGESKKVTLMADESEFWAVMDDLMEQADLRLNSFAMFDDKLVLAAIPEGGSAAVASYSSGPFRIDAISTRSTLPLGYTGGVAGQLDFSFYVTWEPRLKPVFMQIPMSSVQGTADSGGELVAANQAASPEIALNFGGCTEQVDLQLARPPRDAKTLTSLKGQFVIAVPSERHDFVFSKFGNGARQSETFGDVTVTLEGARRNGPVYEMPLRIQFGNSQGALESFRSWLASNKAYLLDKKDVRLPDSGYNTYGATGNSVGIAYRFQVNGDPNDYRLVYESPASISRQTIDYELKDIPLP